MLLRSLQRAAWARVVFVFALAAIGAFAVPAAAGAATKAGHAVAAAKDGDREVVAAAGTEKVGRHKSKRRAAQHHARHRHVVKAKQKSHRRHVTKQRTKRVAKADDGESRSRGRRASGGGNITWRASAGCLNGTLRGVLSDISGRFGHITVNSTCRSREHNARVGGASRSMHLTGDAVDFRVHGNYGGLAGYVRNRVGGFKHYGGGLFHIDTGARRSW